MYVQFLELCVWLTHFCWGEFLGPVYRLDIDNAIYMPVPFDVWVLFVFST